MRKLLYFCFAIALISCLAAACKRELTAREAAEKYYGCLIRGDVEGYMQGMADYDSLTTEYREQLRDMFLQYLDYEERMRSGFISVKATRDTLIDERSSYVFVMVTYGDSTQEQLSLPLVLTDKGWRMK